MLIILVVTCTGRVRCHYGDRHISTSGLCESDVGDGLSASLHFLRMSVLGDRLSAVWKVGRRPALVLPELNFAIFRKFEPYFQKIGNADLDQGLLLSALKHDKKDNLALQTSHLASR